MEKGKKKLIRKPKPEDQDQADEAVRLICQLMSMNKGIDPNQWMSGLLSMVAWGFKKNELNYEEFVEEMDAFKKLMKGRWDDN